MAFEIRKIGVVGASQMGVGIAQVSALAGFDVVLNDLSEERIDAAIARIDANLGRLIEREALTTADKTSALARIKPATEFSSFADADLVMEAAAENEDVKRKIFSTLCAYLKSE